MATLAGRARSGVGVLDAMKEGRVIQVDVLEEEPLPHLVVGEIPEVLRRQGHLVDGTK